MTFISLTITTIIAHMTQRRALDETSRNPHSENTLSISERVAEHTAHSIPESIATHTSRTHAEHIARLQTHTASPSRARGSAAADDLTANPA